MRAPAVLLNVIIAGTLGGFAGYSLAQREARQEISTLRQEHQVTLLREQEARAQLEAALAARAALEQQSQQLQTELSERLRRLEDLAVKLNPSSSPPEAGSTVSTEPEPKSDSTP